MLYHIPLSRPARLVYNCEFKMEENAGNCKGGIVKFKSTKRYEEATVVYKFDKHFKKEDV